MIFTHKIQIKQIINNKNNNKQKLSGPKMKYNIWLNQNIN